MSPNNLVTTLYCGTTSELNERNVNIQRRFGEFGRGFYMDVSKSRAADTMERRRRAALKRGRPSGGLDERLYEIRLNESELDGMSVKVFEKSDMEWLEFVLTCLESDSAWDYDIVAGPAADEDVALYLKVYDAGQYGEKGTEQAKSTLLKVIDSKNLGVTYCICRQEAADSAIESIREIERR